MSPNLPAAQPGAIHPDAGTPQLFGGDAVDGRKLTSAEKAAIIIAALGAEAAPSIFQGVGESTIRRFAESMTKLGHVTPELLERTIEEFNRELGGSNKLRVGSAEARRFLSGLLDDDSVSRIMDDVGLSNSRTLWERLSNSSDQALAGFLRHEHPQTVAVILSKLRSEKAARVLERLDPAFAQVIVLRLSRVPRLDSQVMDLVMEVIQREFIAVMQREQATRRPADVIGSVMNNVPNAKRGKLMEQLEQQQPKIAKQVQKILFSFADIPARVDPRDAAVLMRAVDDRTMLLALKFAQINAPKVIDFVLNNISKRLSQRMETDLKQHAEIQAREGEAAQQAVVSAVRDLAKTGDLRMLDAEEEDE
ncbi:MAG: FliG C-terminal domain-containing protein [Rubrimonas sp.]